MTDKKYYLSLFVPSRSRLEDIDPELCLLRNTFDYLSGKKDYCVDLGYEYSGNWLIMIHMTVYGIDLDPFIVRRGNRWLKEPFPKFRLWTVADGYIIEAEELKGVAHPYLAEGKEILSWKGAYYRSRNGTSD